MPHCNSIENEWFCSKVNVWRFPVEKLALKVFIMHNRRAFTFKLWTLMFQDYFPVAE